MNFEERLHFLSSAESGGRDEVETWRQEFARRNALEQRAAECLRTAEEKRRRWTGENGPSYEDLEDAELLARAELQLARRTG